MTHDRKYVYDSINDRTGHKLTSADDSDRSSLPENISLTDGLTEDEAVAIALWNNAQFQADLTELGISRADLIEAGMISNPVFSILLSTGPKQMEATLLNLPIDILWQRPFRISTAKLNAERVAENLVLHGLNLVRDVMVTYTNLFLAQEYAKIVKEEIELNDKIVAIAQSQLLAGDISELKETTLKLDAARKRESLVNYLRDASLLVTELKTLLGLRMEEELKLSPSTLVIDQTFNLQDLLSTAFAARPDLRAAEISVEAAGKQLGWERSKIFKITAIGDFNERGTSGPEFGPGFMFEPPVFNWNNGKVSRAAAQLEQAVKQYYAVKQQIALNVSKAYTNYTSAQKSLKIQRLNILNMTETATSKAERQYSVGEISYLEYLGFKSQLLVARFNDIRCEAELRLSAARLRHSIGFKQIRSNIKSTDLPK